MKTIRTTAPRHSILHPAFRYTPAAETDIRRTFMRARKQQEATAASNVKPLKRRQA